MDCTSKWLFHERFSHKTCATAARPDRDYRAARAGIVRPCRWRNRVPRYRLGLRASTSHGGRPGYYRDDSEIECAGADQRSGGCNRLFNGRAIDAPSTVEPRPRGQRVDRPLQIEVEGGDENTPRTNDKPFPAEVSTLVSQKLSVEHRPIDLSSEEQPELPVSEALANGETTVRC